MFSFNPRRCFRLEIEHWSESYEDDWNGYKKRQYLVSLTKEEFQKFDNFFIYQMVRRKIDNLSSFRYSTRPSWEPVKNGLSYDQLISKLNEDWSRVCRLS